MLKMEVDVCARWLVLWTIILLVGCVYSDEFKPKDYCLPTESCWPSNDVFRQLQSDNPTMTVVLPGNK